MIRREILSEITKWIESDQFIILKGARRVGKTTILKTLQENLECKNAFITCDDIDFKIKTPEELIFYLREFHGFNNEDKFVLFLDEFQYLKEAGIFLKNLYDKYQNLKVIASGSSSLEISKNTEFLTGRSIEFNINPLSFFEFTCHELEKEINRQSIENFSAIEMFWKFYKEDLQRLFMKYISWGGYPQIVLEQDISKKLVLLNNYLEKYLEKDIAGFLQVGNISTFRNVVKLAASQIGNLVNVNEISNTLNSSYKSVSRYLDILEETYVIKRVPPLFRNIRTEISKSPKMFFTDIGLRNAVLKINEIVSQQIDLGAEVENFVFSELQNRFRDNTIRFYRTNSGSEIDFIVENKQNKTLIIEVKFRSKISGNNAAFEKFNEKYPEVKTRKIVLTKDLLQQNKDTDILFLPVSLFSFIVISELQCSLCKF